MIKSFSWTPKSWSRQFWKIWHQICWPRSMEVLPTKTKRRESRVPIQLKCFSKKIVCWGLTPKLWKTFRQNLHMDLVEAFKVIVDLFSGKRIDSERRKTGQMSAESWNIEATFCKLLELLEQIMFDKTFPQHYRREILKVFKTYLRLWTWRLIIILIKILRPAFRKLMKENSR